jgi:hypothetical protein
VISNLIASGGLYGNCGIEEFCLVWEIHRTHVDRCIIQIFVFFLFPVWRNLICSGNSWYNCVFGTQPPRSIHIYRRTKEKKNTCSHMVSFFSASWTNYRVPSLAIFFANLRSWVFPAQSCRRLISESFSKYVQVLGCRSRHYAWLRHQFSFLSSACVYFCSSRPFFQHTPSDMHGLLLILHLIIWYFRRT